MTKARMEGVPRAAIVTLAILSLVSLCNNMDRMLMAAVAHPVQLEFHLSDTQLGMLTGFAFALFYAACGLPLGRVSDRVSRRKLIVLALVGWSAMTAVTGFAQSFTQIFLARMGVGLGEAGTMPSAQSLVSDAFPPRSRNFAISILFAAMTLGSVGGFALGAWLAQTYGWRVAFFVLGTPGIFIAVIVVLFLKEPPRGATDPAGSAALPGLVPAIAMLLHNRTFVLLTLGTTLNSVGALGLAQWMPMFFIRSHGLSLAEAGLIFGTAAGLGMGVGQLLGGVSADRLATLTRANPLWVSVGANLVVVPVALAALWLPSTGGAAIAIVVAAVLGSTAAPPACAGVLNAVSAGVRGLSVATVSATTAIFGTGLAPVLVGRLSDFLAPSYGPEALRHALSFAQIAYIGAAILYYLALRSAPAASSQQIEPHYGSFPSTAR